MPIKHAFFLFEGWLVKDIGLTKTYAAFYVRVNTKSIDRTSDQIICQHRQRSLLHTITSQRDPPSSTPVAAAGTLADSCRTAEYLSFASQRAKNLQECTNQLRRGDRDGHRSRKEALTKCQLEVLWPRGTRVSLRPRTSSVVSVLICF